MRAPLATAKTTKCLCKGDVDEDKILIMQKRRRVAMAGACDACLDGKWRHVCADADVYKDNPQINWLTQSIRTGQMNEAGRRKLVSGGRCGAIAFYDS